MPYLKINSRNPTKYIKIFENCSDGSTTQLIDIKGKDIESFIIKLIINCFKKLKELTHGNYEKEIEIIINTDTMIGLKEQIRIEEIGNIKHRLDMYSKEYPALFTLVSNEMRKCE